MAFSSSIVVVLPLSCQNKTDGLDLSNALTLPFSRGKKIVFIGDYSITSVRNLFFGLYTLVNDME